MENKLVFTVVNHSPAAGDSLMVQAYPSSDSLAEQLQGFVNKAGSTDLSPVMRNVPAGPEEWAIVVLLLAFSLLVLSRHMFPRLFSQSIQASGANNHLNQMLRENNPSKHFIGTLFFISYSMLFALFLYIQLPTFSDQQTTTGNGLPTYATIFMMVIVMLLFKLATINLLSWLFRTSEIALYFKAHHFVFFLIGAVLFLILILLNLYNPGVKLVIFSLLAAGLFMVYRFIRSFMATLPLAKFSFMYLFLYLCALEIVPLMLLVKVVLQLGNGSITSLL